MRHILRKTILRILLVLLLAGMGWLGAEVTEVYADSFAPVLFFSDLTDGPISGWEGSTTKGAAVSIWGKNFGSSRGISTVTACGVTLNNDSDFAEWGVINKPAVGQDPKDAYSSARDLERITFWLRSDMTIGPGTISVTTAQGTSNTIPFYCRVLADNHIYFISRSGNDSNNGLYSAQGLGNNGPWLSAKKIKSLQAGDIAYFREGVWNEKETTHYYYNAVVEFWLGTNDNGRENNSITVASYPGEFAQIGDGSVNFSILIGNGYTLNYWTFSKLMLRANAVAWLSRGGQDDHIRIIGNDASNTAGDPVGSIFGFSGDQSNFYLYGNHLHDAEVNKRGDKAADSPRSYPLYIAGFGFHNYIYIGWNEFAWCENGRVQFYGHISGDWIDNLYFHDNYIHHMGREGVILGGSDGGTFMRKCYFYNNVIAFNGTRNGYGILLSGASGGSGDFSIYNNTFYQNSSGEVGYAMQIVSSTFKNNIVSAKSGESYYEGAYGGGTLNAIGSNNCYYGGTDGIPSWDNYSIAQDPKLINPANADFHLQSDSQCIDAGTADIASLVTKDYDGILRPQGAGYDIGAYEYASSTVVKGDVNGDGLVNVVDVQLAVNQFLGVLPQTQEADLNGDGVVNVIDVQLLVNIILSLAT